MARLTWRNMQAPDFRDVAAMQQNSGNLFAEGFSGLGDIATGIDNKNVQAAAMERKRMEDAMMQQALAGSDPTQDGNWARVMGAGPASMIGDMSAHLKDQQGQYDSRADRQNTRADTANVIVDTAADKFKLGQDEIGAQRAEEVYQRQEQERMIGLEAQEWANQAKYGFKTKEEAERAIALDPSLTPSQRKARQTAIAGASDSIYGQNPDSVAAFNTRPDVIGVRAVLAEQEQELKIEEGNVPGLAALERGLAAESGNVQEEITKIANTMVGKDGEPLFEDSAGTLTTQLNGLIDTYGDRLGSDIVTGVFLNHVENADWGLWGEQDLQPNEKAIKKQLDLIDTPDERKRLSTIKSEFGDRLSRLQENRRQLDKAEATAGTAGYRQEENSGRFMKDADDIVKSLVNNLIPKEAEKPNIGPTLSGTGLLTPDAATLAAGFREARSAEAKPPSSGGNATSSSVNTPSANAARNLEAGVPYAGDNVNDLRAARTGEFRERNLEADALNAQRRVGPGKSVSGASTIIDAAVNRVQEIARTDPATKAIVDAFKRTGKTPDAKDMREKDAKAAGLSPDTVKQFNALRDKEAKGTLTPEQQAVLESLRLIISVSK